MAAKPRGATMRFPSKDADNFVEERCSHTAEEHARMHKIDNTVRALIEKVQFRAQLLSKSARQLPSLTPLIEMKRTELETSLLELQQKIPDIDREALILKRLTRAQRSILCDLIEQSIRRGGYVDIKTLSNRDDSERVKILKLLKGRDTKGARWQRGSPLIQKLVVMSPEIIDGRTYATYRPSALSFSASLWKLLTITKETAHLLAKAYGYQLCVNEDTAFLLVAANRLSEAHTELQSMLKESTSKVGRTEANYIGLLSTVFPPVNVDQQIEKSVATARSLVELQGSAAEVSETLDYVITLGPSEIMSKIMEDSSQTRQWIEPLLECVGLLQSLCRSLIVFDALDRKIIESMDALSRSFGSMLALLNTIDKNFEDIRTKRMVDEEKHTQLLFLLEESVTHVMGAAKRYKDEVDGMWLQKGRVVETKLPLNS